MAIRVLLVNQIRLMCNIITSVIEDEPDIEVVGCATSPEEALAIVRRGIVDVAVVSTKLPAQGALELTTPSRRWRHGRKC